VKKEDIGAIELGPRQLQFGFEKETLSVTQSAIIAYIQQQTEKHGHAFFDECIEYAKKIDASPNFAIMQAVFWLAEDLKIFFKINGANITPHDLKKILIKSTKNRVKIVTNEPVDKPVFDNVKCIYQELFREKITLEHDDQYGFSRLLIKRARGWKIELESCSSSAKQPFFPYKKKIDDCLHVIENVLIRRDSFSIIYAFYDNRERLLKLARDIRQISGFYSQHTAFWKTLIQSVEEFNHNLSEHVKDAEIIAGIEDLKQTISSPDPFIMITEAETLLIKTTQQCRLSLPGEVDHMISKMKAHLDTHKPGKDLQNKALFYLRSIKSRIDEAGDIKSISDCLIDAEEKFDAFWEEVKA